MPLAAGHLRLIAPTLARLAQYEAALAAGWSPDTSHDVSAEQLAALRWDPDAFLAELTRQDGMIVTASGLAVPRLPSRVFSDYVSGHIGYAVVPWKRRRGYATGALALVLPVAREVGLKRIEITCDDDNEASRRVILKNGAEFVGTRPFSGGRAKLVFRIDLRDRG